MKRVLLFILILLFPLIADSIMDMAFGPIDITFEVINVDESGTLSIPVNSTEKSYKFFEVVWDTGDTGRSITITHTGTYRVSVKDKWQKQNTQQYLGPFFVKGLPDTVIIDTFIYNISDGPVDIGTRTKQITINRLGKIKTDNYNFSSWISNGKFYYTEPHAEYLGFWSGKLDSITIKEASLPMVINAKILIHNNRIITKNQWVE